jgi:tRNA (mo5U34)-methyltransferase
MCPWRKGPFRLFGVDIDTEWRSDMKWARVVSALSDLRGRTVLDVGCGNGYYLYRMKGAGAENVIGVDPYLHFVVQSLIFAHFLGHDALPVLPLAAEQIPDNLEAFDTVFSMGILYHRRSPFEHLFRLKAFLRPGGELVLETLVIEGKEGEVLVPEGRYAKMNNVWFIPSVDELVRWLKRCGFVSIQVADCSVTTPDEQRRTDWMRFESLTDYLDPLYSDRTVEGYPAPRRAVLIAQKPE